jgi:hypothetical protein
MKLLWTLERIGLDIEVPIEKRSDLRADLADALAELDAGEPTRRRTRRKTTRRKSTRRRKLSFTCETCGRSFGSPRGLTHHQTVAHP